MTFNKINYIIYVFEMQLLYKVFYFNELLLYPFNNMIAINKKYKIFLKKQNII